MRPFFILDDKKEPFAKGHLLEDNKCAISFLKVDYSFVYENLEQLMLMHGNEGKNEIKFLDEEEKKSKTKVKTK
jgi:hypothetical protein